MKNITVYTDASHCPNTLVGGWGAYIRVDSGKYEFSGNFESSANPAEAEFKAACNGLSRAKLLMPTYDGHVILVTDCLAVKEHIDYMTAQGKPPRKHKCNKFLKGFIAGLPEGTRLIVNKVKAHSMQDGKRSWVNARVDELAKIQMKAIRPDGWRKIVMKRDKAKVGRQVKKKISKINGDK